MYRPAISAALCVAGLSVVAIASGQPADAEPDEGTLATPMVTLKRRSDLSDEDLRKQLQTVPETGLNQGAAATLYAPLTRAGSKVTNLPSDLGPRFFGQLATQMKRTEQLALPWRAGPDCEMGKESAERLHVLSLRLREALRTATPTGDIRPDPDKLRTLLAADAAGRGSVEGKGRQPRLPTAGGNASEWRTPAAIPTLTQMLQTENSPIRLLLVEMLAAIPGKEASIAMAQRALFDISPDVREKAVQALAPRPVPEFKQVLLYGLNYPWAAAADHAAEAIVALQLAAIAPDVVDLLKEPNPNLPMKMQKVHVIREVVRVNHLSNCMLCHAPSLSKDDLIRGRMPMPGEDPPPLYYAERTGLFVRADITFLRQDFSVVQPVPDSGKWPGNQRYDYVLRTRQTTAREMKAYQQLENDNKLPKTFPQREAMLYALREVTKMDAGKTYADWTREMPKLLKVIKDQGQK